MNCAIFFFAVIANSFLTVIRSMGMVAHKKGRLSPPLENELGGLF